MTEDLKVSLGVRERAAGLPPSPPPANYRPTAYTPEIAETILFALAEGELLTDVCAADDMPARSTVYRWLHADPDFARRYGLAIELRAQHRVDQLSELNEKLLAGDVPPQEAKVIADNLKWLAAREDPRRFSDRLLQELTGPNGKDLIPEKKMTDVEVARWIAFKFAKGTMALEEEMARKSAASLDGRDA